MASAAIRDARYMAEPISTAFAAAHIASNFRNKVVKRSRLVRDAFQNINASREVAAPVRTPMLMCAACRASWGIFILASGYIADDGAQHHAGYG